jgi:hypothetical protein
MPKEEASKLVMRAIAGRSEQAGAYMGQAMGAAAKPCSTPTADDVFDLAAHSLA